jgi:1-acyl-sn-glycerol-3-phosphate acyltransferase
MQKFSKFILKLKGWKVVGEVPTAPKMVVCFAPHTSNWDFVWGKLVAWAIDFKMSFLIKEEWVNRWGIGWWLKKQGAVPVSRQKNTSLTDRMADTFKQYDKLNLVLSPEGSRQAVADWKKGFYYIALKANVPILPLVMDYGKKEVIIKDFFIPTGNEEEDIKCFKAIFAGSIGKKPHQFTTGLETA